VSVRVRLDRFSCPSRATCITAVMPRGVTPLADTVGVCGPSWWPRWAAPAPRLSRGGTRGRHWAWPSPRSSVSGRGSPPGACPPPGMKNPPPGTAAPTSTPLPPPWPKPAVAVLSSRAVVAPRTGSPRLCGHGGGADGLPPCLPASSPHRYTT